MGVAPLKKINQILLSEKAKSCKATTVKNWNKVVPLYIDDTF